LESFRAAAGAYRDAVAQELKEHRDAAKLGTRGLQARLAAATEEVAALSALLRAVEALLAGCDSEGQHHVTVDAVRAVLHPRRHYDDHRPGRARAALAPEEKP